MPTRTIGQSDIYTHCNSKGTLQDKTYDKVQRCSHFMRRLCLVLEIRYVVYGPIVSHDSVLFYCKHVKCTAFFVNFKKNNMVDYLPPDISPMWNFQGDLDE